MWVSKDFIVPRFNYVEHFEKPIFAFFIASLSMGFWGINNLGARFPAALSAIAGVAAAYYFTRELFDKKTAELAAVILATTAGYFLVGRYAMIDMVLTFLLSASFFCLGLACLQKKPNFYLAFYGFMSLAFLTKGLIGLVLPGLAFLPFLVWTGNLGELKRVKPAWGVLIIAALFIPWGIAISIQEPEFSYVFFTQQQVSRFATGHFGRSRPFWFFVPIFFALTFPWSVFLPAAVSSGLRQAGDLRKNAVRFLVCWAAVILVFFSIPRSKLPYYILPAAAPAAILVAVWLRGLSDATNPASSLRRAQFRRMAGVLGWLVSAALAGLNVYVFSGARDARLEALKSLLPAATFFLMAGVLIGRRFVKRNEYDRAILSIALTIMAAFHVMGMGMQRLSPYLSTYEEAQVLKKEMKEGDVVSVFASPDRFSDLPFHLARRIMVVGSDRGTLSREVEEDAAEVGEWFPSASEFLKLFQARQKRVFCLMDEKNLAELKKIGLEQYGIVRSGGGKILISN